MRRGRGAVAVVAGLLAAATISVPAAGPATAAPAVPTPRGATASPEAAASVAARDSGSRVEVTARRSETQQVFANPDGTFTAEVYATPVRVHRADGSWAPVDTTLRARADGFLAPVSTAVPVRFSGGGTSPLATLSRGGHELAVTWPGRLPKPVVSGDTATYRSVLPGVDLRVRAEYAGFAQELVVASAAAAANPALRRIRLGLDAPGLTVRTNADRSLSAVSKSGAVVFRSPPAAMWDAPERGSAAPAAGGASADPAQAGVRRAPVGVTVTGRGLEVVPDAGMLTSSATRFPLVIDPSWTATNPAWTLVNAYDPNSATWRTADGTLAVGYQNYSSPYSLVRTYLRFGLKSDIFDAHVLSASVRMYEVWSSSCTATGMKMYGTGGFDSATTWNNQPTWGRYLDTATVAYGHSTSCGPNWVALDATSWIASAAAAHTSYPTFGLRASDETDPLGWKKFTPSGTNGPRLDVVYNHPPNAPAPSAMKTSNPTSSCATTQASAQRVNITSGAGITVTLTPTDIDSGDYLETTIQFWQYGGVSPLETYVSPKKVNNPASPTPVTTTMLKGVALRAGLYYVWRAVVKDYTSSGVYMDTSAKSQDCWLLYDPTAPSPPVVSSTDYTPDAYAGAAGKAGVFSFNPGSTADTDIVSYRYGVDTPSPTSTVAASGGAASVSVAPPSYGPHDLFVQAVDGANNVSSAIAYHFFVSSPTDAVGYWKFNESSGTTTNGTVESGPGTSGPTATLTGGAVFTTSGRLDGGVSLDGTSGVVTTGAATHVDTAQPFAVTAWVKLGAKTTTQVIASEDGTQVSGFTLGYRADLDRWVASMPTADSASASVDTAASASVPSAGAWTHLGIVFDGAKIRLFVNGLQESTTTHTTTWSAAGNLLLGRGLVAGAAGEFLGGTVDEVRVYNRALAFDASQVGEVADIYRYTVESTPAGAWDFSETTGTTAADSSPGNHALTLSSGAGFTATGHSGGGLVLDGVAGNATTAAPVLHTNKSYTVAAWVKLSSDQQVATVIGQDGTDISGFRLRYEPDFFGGYWIFGIPAADSSSGSTAQRELMAAPTDTSGVWVHVTASYNGFTHQMMIRVKDSWGIYTAPIATPDLPWDASGVVRVGAGMSRDATSGAVLVTDFFPGVVDQVRIFGGVLSDADLRGLEA